MEKNLGFYLRSSFKFFVQVYKFAQMNTNKLETNKHKATSLLLTEYFDLFQPPLN
jgi:hypothetical protein